MSIYTYEVFLDGYPVRMRLSDEDPAATERAVAEVVRLVRPFLDETDIREAIGYERGPLTVLQVRIGDTDHSIAVAVFAGGPDRIYVADATKPGQHPLTQPERARFVSSREVLSAVRKYAGASL